MTEKSEVIDAVILGGSALNGTEEFNLGMRELRKRLLNVNRWYLMNEEEIPVQAFSEWSNAPWLLVITNPAILISDNLLAELMAVSDDNTLCALPADPRGFTSGVDLNYASRPGFDRFVARLMKGPKKGGHDNRIPWIYLVAREALLELSENPTAITWTQVPELLGTRTAIAHHAFVHSYANYHSNTRSEMLDLLPTDIQTLLDVGGGDGNFARAFMAERGGHAVLLEANDQTARLARERGMEVFHGNFESVTATQTFDCVALLDVLEHMPNPLSALVHARSFLKPRGVLLISLPNVGHWSVVWDLLEGRFDYQPVGILCNTHLRFFTRYGLQTLLADAGFRIERWESAASPPPEAFNDFLDHFSTKKGEQEIKPDRESLGTESFHVLARLD